MARLFAWIPLVAGALATVPVAAPFSIGGESSSTDISVTTVGSSSTIIIISSNSGGSAMTQNWNQPPMAAGQVHQVTVGGTAGLVYTPDTVTAAVGDMIQFNFMSKNHTVTQSSFPEPCVKMAGGVDSGFMPNADNTLNPPPMMMFQVTTTDPVWMYCRQTGHCGKGMVFSVNPTADKSQAAFKAAAMAINGTAGASAQVASSSVAIAPPAATPAAVSPPASGSSGNIVQGSGTLDSGSACSCSCLCGTGDFPAGAGMGMIGGMGGSMSIPAAAVLGKKRSALEISH